MARAIRFVFGLAAYVFFFASFLYLIGFVTNLFVPRAIDGVATTSTGLAALINLLLVALFGAQHSVMARPGFKAALTKYWPPAIERSLYVALTAVVLCILFWCWQPMPTLIWSAESDALRITLWVIAAAGWTIVLISTFLISHFELFGLQQIWADLLNRKLPITQFRQPFFYKLVRHPIYTGFLLAFWSSPDMSQGHALFAFAMTLYIFIGIRYEERDLKAHLGEPYSEYSRQVGMVIPGVGKGRD